MTNNTAQPTDVTLWENKIKEAIDVDRDTIKEKVLEYALDGADNGCETFEDYLDNVTRTLQSIDCAACASPAPIFHSAMALEIGVHCDEIADCLEEYYDATGEHWMPNAKDGTPFLTYLWFAYEWRASELANEIENLQIGE